MFSSLKIKTFFFLTLLMATTACLTIIFTHRDVGNAMLSERPYKTAWPIEKALDEIQSESGSYFDPRLVTLFMEMETDLRRIVQALGSL